MKKSSDIKKPVDKTTKKSSTAKVEAKVKAALLEKAKSLRSCALFQDLDDEQIRRMATQFHRNTYEAGETIFKQGDLGHKIYIVSKGQVSLERLVNLGGGEANVMVSLLGRYRLLGCWACILGESRNLTESAVCKRQTLVISAEGAELRDFLEGDPQLETVLLHRLCIMLGDKIQEAYSAWDFL
ncbi:MAG: cyclic nucleotide-binding domain-containing protein [Chloroflexi bacterium]|nr:cyclic nucleotide-binding domain-containing protein [Chloroflexota bacterium]